MTRRRLVDVTRSLDRLAELLGTNPARGDRFGRWLDDQEGQVPDETAARTMLRLPQLLLDRVDAVAAATGARRSGVLRKALDLGLGELRARGLRRPLPELTATGASVGLRFADEVLAAADELLLTLQGSEPFLASTSATRSGVLRVAIALGVDELEARAGLRVVAVVRDGEVVDVGADTDADGDRVDLRSTSPEALAVVRRRLQPARRRVVDAGRDQDIEAAIADPTGAALLQLALRYGGVPGAVVTTEVVGRVAAARAVLPGGRERAGSEHVDRGGEVAAVSALAVELEVEPDVPGFLNGYWLRVLPPDLAELVDQVAQAGHIGPTASLLRALRAVVQIGGHAHLSAGRWTADELAPLVAQVEEALAPKP